jgi:hypothetical protein
MNTEKKNKSGMYGYLKKLIPSGAIIDFVFYEDFDGDDVKEAVVGFTEFIPFPPESSVVYLKNTNNELKHIELLSSLLSEESINYGIFDNVAIADLDNDEYPEIVLSLATGNGHYISLYVFDCLNGKPRLVWKSDEPFLHGSMEVLEKDNEGLIRIIADSGTYEGKELIGLDEANYHVRKSCCFCWNGSTFDASEHQVRMPYRSYNTAVAFMMHLLKHEYKKAYEMVLMPGFMGLKGLDDCSLEAFRKYVCKNIMPVLQRNLAKKKLIPSEPYDDFCLFCGVYEDIAVEFVNKGGQLLIQCVNIYKKT